MDFSVLKGKTLVSIVNESNEKLTFTTDNGEVYELHHFQDCCEHVRIEEIIGDLDDLLNEPLWEAEKIDGGHYEPNCYQSQTWTFYKLRTRKGGVTLRWLGESNGYYSESVDFVKVK